MRHSSHSPKIKLAPYASTLGCLFDMQLYQKKRPVSQAKNGVSYNYNRQSCSINTSSFFEIKMYSYKQELRQLKYVAHQNSVQRHVEKPHQQYILYTI